MLKVRRLFECRVVPVQVFHPAVQVRVVVANTGRHVQRESQPSAREFVTNDGNDALKTYVPRLHLKWET